MSPLIYKSIKEVAFARMDRRIAGFEREGVRAGGEGRPENLSRSLRQASTRMPVWGTVFAASKHGP